jgi:hypothetical protein
MAWSAPPTFTAGTIPTAANFNTLADDLEYLKGLDGSVTIENSLLLGANALAFGNTTLFRTITSALTSFHVADAGGAVKFALYLPASSQSYSGGVTVLPTGAVSFAAAACCLVYNNASGATAWQFPSGAKGASAVSIDPTTSALSWRCESDGRVTVTRTSGSATWTVGMILIYY